VAPTEDWNEDLYQATSAVLAAPELAGSAGRNLGCLLASAALFALASWKSFDPKTLALVVGVLLLHESGHYLGMRLFGYSNVRMFFIPFFGAAVAGRKHAAPAWQQGVVLLLGPLPGIFLGLALQAWLRPDGDSPLGTVVLWLVILNAFNLLPIVPFDGGRLVDLLLFAHRPLLTVGFTLFAVLALAQWPCRSATSSSAAWRYCCC
jgi:hypothetical protein